MNLLHMDAIHINPTSPSSSSSSSLPSSSPTITVGAGATVSSILKELSKHNLTLSNFSSIQEQQIAGWTQVAAHGTGASLSTVDDMILEMKMVSPSLGPLTLSKSSLPHYFDYAKVALGALGVVTDLTLQCIPKMALKEETIVFPQHSKLSSSGHIQRLKDYRHVRYMWIPWTETVVSVVSNPVEEALIPSDSNLNGKGEEEKEKEKMNPLLELLFERKPIFASNKNAFRDYSFSQLRDELLAIDPLNLALVQRINQAEADYWTTLHGTSRVDDSTKILGFDCGGQQLVLEVCFNMGTLQKNEEKEKNGEATKDVLFVQKLLQANFFFFFLLFFLSFLPPPLLLFVFCSFSYFYA